MPENQPRFSLITEKSLADLRKLIGVPIEDTVEPWCYEATRDNIRHWAYGIGDDNPLWCDPAYAAQTQYGRLVAPPSFVFTLNRSFSGYVAGLPGVHAMFAGIDVTGINQCYWATSSTPRHGSRIWWNIRPALPAAPSSRFTTRNSTISGRNWWRKVRAGAFAR